MDNPISYKNEEVRLEMEVDDDVLSEENEGDATIGGKAENLSQTIDVVIKEDTIQLEISNIALKEDKVPASIPDTHLRNAAYSTQIPSVAGTGKHIICKISMTLKTRLYICIIPFLGIIFWP